MRRYNQMNRKESLEDRTQAFLPTAGIHLLTQVHQIHYNLYLLIEHIYHLDDLVQKVPRVR